MSAMKKVLIFVIILLAAGGLIGFGVYNASRGQEAAGIPKNAVPARLESPHRETIISRVTAKGIVELTETHSVFPGTQARISRVHVKQGDEVKAGDILVSYDLKTLEGYLDQLAEAELALKSAELALSTTVLPSSMLEMMQAQAQISQAEKSVADINAQGAQMDINISQLYESLRTAERKYEDANALFILGAATKTETDNALEQIKNIENQIETAQAQKENALSALPLAQENLQLAKAQNQALINKLTEPHTLNQIQSQQNAIDQARLRISQIQRNIDEFKSEEIASVSGTVIGLFASEGDVASSGRALMEIADTTPNNLTISVFIPENDAKYIAPGQKAEIKGAALGQTAYPAHVGKIHPLAEKRQMGNTVETVLTVEIDADDKNIPLRAGYSVESNIVTGTAEDTLVIPLMATLSDTDGNYFVYLMREDYSVEKRIVTLGEYTGLYVQAQGVEEHERVILNPSGQIVEGAFVKPI